MASMKAVLNGPAVLPGINILGDTSTTALTPTLGRQNSIKESGEQSLILLGDFQGGRYAWVVSDAKNFAVNHRLGVSKGLADGPASPAPFLHLRKPEKRS